MKQVLIRRGKVVVENVPAPLAEPGHVLVEVAFSLISTGTELSSLQRASQSMVKKALDQPERLKKLWDNLLIHGLKKTFTKVQGQMEQAVLMGYSCSGFVIQVGEGLTEFQPGDRVACAGAGIANHAEIVLAPRNLVVKIPDGCDLCNAASMTLGAIALQGVRRADPRLGEIVTVIGLGLLGQITVQLLKATGCKVIGLELNERRIALAKQLGADVAINPTEVDIYNEIRHLTEDNGVDATIVTAESNSDDIVQQAIDITRKKGRVVVVGAVGLGLKRSPLYEKEIDFLISCSYGPGRYDEKYEEKGLDYPYPYVRWTENRNMQEYLRLVAENKVNLGPILEREYDLVEAPRAYEELLAAPEKPLGVLLRYGSKDENALELKLNTKILLHSRPVSGKIRIAVIGAGGFAKEIHLPNLKKLSDFYHIRAIVSRTGSNAKAAAQQFGADYTSSNYQDVLDDPDVDAVIICTRHHLHAQQAIQAANAGKAIFLEKPMALNQVELDQLTSIIENTGVPFMVGFNRRFSPAIRRIKEIIGKQKNPLMILYRMNAGYLDKNHWTQTEEGGGRIIGEACHIFDTFRYLIEEPVTELTSTTIMPRTDHILSEDNSLVSLRYEDGSVAVLLYTALGTTTLGKEYMELYSDGRVLVLDDYKSLQVYGTKIKEWTIAHQDKGHLEELRNFALFMHKAVGPPITLKELYDVTMQSFIAAGHNYARRINQ